MASLNIAEWSPDRVAEWLEGLGPSVAQYVPVLRERGLNGAKLLMLRCDDLEYLGIHVIGHQELLLEAVEHLRNFQYEAERECVQQLALRVSVAGATLARALRCQPLARIETHTLADVARVVHAVKPLVCWLDRWPLCSGAPLAQRKAALLQLALEAAACAQRERFADQPTSAVADAAAALAQIADYIIQDVSDPMILQPASVDSVTLRQGARPLGFEVVPSFCGHHQLAAVRFGSPAHASGAVHDGDEIVQVGSQCVIGWNGEAVSRACASAAACGGELALRLRRRGARPALGSPPHRRAPRPVPPLSRLMPFYNYVHFDRTELISSQIPRERAMEAAGEAGAAGAVGDAAAGGGEGGASSDDSEALSPPASPTQLHPDHTRMYPPKPRAAVQRRYTISCGSPVSKRPNLSIEQFWQELKEQKWVRHPAHPVHPAHPALTPDPALYRRDKAVSCSTGLELSPRPRTCLGVALNHPILNKLKANNAKLLVDEEIPHSEHRDSKLRGKLDKSHSTPAYDFDGNPADEPGPLVTQIIPESPTTPTDSPTILVHSAEKADQILDFKKSSSQIGEAILQQQRRVIGTEEKTEITYVEKTEVKVKDLSEIDKLELIETMDGEDDSSSKVEKVLETINIAMMERHNKETGLVMKQTHKTLTVIEAGPQNTKTFSVSEQVKTIQDEIVQAINEQRIANMRYSKFQPPNPTVTRPSDVPPEPPPRPASTQRPVLREPPLPPTDAIREFPVLRPVPRQPETPEPKEYSPLKPMRPSDGSQISLPLRHITKHDIRVIPSERRELPAINGEPEITNSLDLSKRKDSNVEISGGVSATVSTQSLSSPHLDAIPSPVRSGTLSPTSSVVRGIFPSSKSKSLKKKNSMLAKRRLVGARDAGAGGAAGGVWQRVRARRAAAHARWARRHLLLAGNLLYAYRTPDCVRADCMIYLEGFTVCAASEVKSRAHAFKVYHTGTAFYFAADSRDAMLAWIHLIHRATLLPSIAGPHLDLSKQFSETDYSDTESDSESSDRKNEAKEKEKEKEKDKSKFGSLKKLTHRMQRTESQENVSHSSTSLDRKYLRFFSRNKHKDEQKPSKSKQTGVPIPTEHYRSYRRVAGDTSTAGGVGSPGGGVAGGAERASEELLGEERKARIPKPINFIHASNPNLLDFEKSDFVTKPTLQVPKPKVHKPDNFIGFVTLEEFMLKKQEEERRQVYTNRVLMGIERDKKEDRASGKKAAKELQKQLDRIVPDVIYGELPTYSDDQLPVPVVEQIQGRSLPRTPDEGKDRKDSMDASGKSPKTGRDMKPISVKGKDGYEKIVYPDEEVPRPPRRPPPGYETVFGDSPMEPSGERRSPPGGAGVGGAASAGAGAAVRRSGSARRAPPAPDKLWRDSLRRNDKVHTARGADSSARPALPPADSSPQVTSGMGVSRLRLVFGGRPSQHHQDSDSPPTGPDWGWRSTQYPHLQCPPTFQPESYSLARLAPPAPRPPRDT